ncbi:MAG: outer membrane beta-barrel protein, partial [Sphingobacteriales bacterium]
HLKFIAGSWATHVGYELVDPYLNRNYSMSYMFSYGPFFHTGVKAEATYGKNGFMLGIANPTDLKSTTMDHKYVIAQYSTSTKNDKLKAYLNFQGGKPNEDTKLNQVDLVLNGTLSSQFGIGYNGTVTMIKAREPDGKFGDANSWWGSALYLNYDPASWVGLTLRGEYFNDDKQLNVFSSAAKGGNIFATTLSANFKVDNLTIIPEFRLENASEGIYSKSSGEGTKSSANFLVAVVYKF